MVKLLSRPVTPEAEGSSPFDPANDERGFARHG